jgi:transcriptional regulator with XRE-family HTH domain
MRRAPKRLAEKLLQIRKALGLSQKEMAERLGELAGVKLTYKNVSKYERDRSVPPLEGLLAYSRVANVTMNQIVDDRVKLRLAKRNQSF